MHALRDRPHRQIGAQPLERDNRYYLMNKLFNYVPLLFSVSKCRQRYFYLSYCYGKYKRNFKSPFKKSNNRDWRNGSLVKNTDHSCEYPGLISSIHSQQLTIICNSGYLTHSTCLHNTRQASGAQKYMKAKYPYTFY